jgi:hypothetical protein
MPDERDADLKLLTELIADGRLLRDFTAGPARASADRRATAPGQGGSGDVTRRQAEPEAR